MAVSLVIPSGGTGVPSVWSGDLDAVRRDDNDSGEYPVGFLRHITKNQVRRKSNGSWETPAAEKVIRALVMQLAATYIRHRKEKVAQWVSLRPLLVVFTQENSYEGVARKMQPWWRYGATSEALSTTLEETS